MSKSDGIWASYGKSKKVAAVLAFPFGSLGLHRYYMNRTRTGFLQTLGFICGLIALYIFRFTNATVIFNPDGTTDQTGLIVPLLIMILCALAFIAVFVWSVIDFIRILTGKLHPSVEKETVRLLLANAKNYFSKPQNVILLVLGIILTVTTIAPMVTILTDTVTVHAGAKDAEQIVEGQKYTLFNWTDLFSGNMPRTLDKATKTWITRSVADVYLWTPLKNSVIISVVACVGAIFIGGIFAYLVTRTDMKWKKYLSAVFIFPYIMPQWTLAVVWQNLFNSQAVTGGSDGLLASLFGIQMPLWWCQGWVPCAIVLSIHYASFAYILIGGIFRNMDANLEEAATILNTPRLKTFTRVTMPLVKPAILSTVLLVFSSAMGSYPIPHYLNCNTLSTQYISMKGQRIGEASILAIIMMLFGFGILIINQRTTSGRKNFTTVTGKSGQSSLVRLHGFKYPMAVIYTIFTFLCGIMPILLFAIETFLPNPGDYSFIKNGIAGNLTTKWWLNNDPLAENGMYGQLGILHNKTIWSAFGNTFIVAVLCAFCAGIIGTLIGYCVSKNRRSKWASYVNNMAFLPYLMPALAVAAAFFTFGTDLGIYNTILLLVIAGTVKYIPFASRSALNSMLQISGEIEEAAIIQDVSWIKRMTRIIIPIQKSSIISGFLLPFMTALRELTLFMLLCSNTFIITTMLDYFDEMGLYAFSSGINLLLIVVILVCNFVVNKLTGASIDSGIGGK